MMTNDGCILCFFFYYYSTYLRITVYFRSPTTTTTSDGWLLQQTTNGWPRWYEPHRLGPFVRFFILYSESTYLPITLFFWVDDNKLLSKSRWQQTAYEWSRWSWCMYFYVSFSTILLIYLRNTFLGWRQQPRWQMTVICQRLQESMG